MGAKIRTQPWMALNRTAIPHRLRATPAAAPGYRWNAPARRGIPAIGPGIGSCAGGTGTPSTPGKTGPAPATGAGPGGSAAPRRHAQLRRGRALAGVRIDESVGELQLDGVRVVLLHLQVHVQAVVHARHVAAGGKLVRREQPREAVIVLRIQTHQGLEPSRQQAVSMVQYGTRGQRTNSG